MVSPSSDKVPAATGSGLGDIVQLVNLIGGRRETTTQTMNPGDVAALKQVFADAQAQDFTKLLESIFAQAQGAVPQVGAAYGRRMGRSYGNVGAQSALNELLKQATLEGQKQIAEQQIRNREIQANVGAAIAQNTKGTTQTTSQSTKNPLGAPIGLLLAANALNDVSKGAVFELPKKLLGNIGAGMGGMGAGGSVSSAPALTGSAGYMPMPAPAMAAPATAKAISSTPSTGYMDLPIGTGGGLNFNLDGMQQGISNVFSNPVSSIVDAVTAPVKFVGDAIDYGVDAAQSGWETFMDFLGFGKRKD